MHASTELEKVSLDKQPLCEHTQFQEGPKFKVYRHNKGNLACEKCAAIPLTVYSGGGQEVCLTMCKEMPACKAFYTQYDTSEWKEKCWLLKSRDYELSEKEDDGFSGVPTDECLGQISSDGMLVLRSLRARNAQRVVSRNKNFVVGSVAVCAVGALVAFVIGKKKRPSPNEELELALL
eukprot:NODE_1289_length_1021_cov_89.077160_g990_i0.p1 GENE.NODE_1289_length_1021_cov_89.077160_g990_i0~~NODE_1289_length_1021_cov_89.077160_g990_i0.p1  ORF type:complete len:178 (-),score=43.20 NODE_1289_length_1021_cov_89.077160_g990_i0:257-790(-)